MENIYDHSKFFEKYSQMPRSKQGLAQAGEWHQLKDLIPHLDNKKVLDLGCGFGWHCTYAVQCGAASVIGLDCSQKMLEEAQKRNASSKIKYIQCDLEQFEYPKEEFDFVISNLVLHYIENLNKIFQKVIQALKPGGTFLFNIEHPIFTSGINQQWLLSADGSPSCWPVDNYFYPGLRETNFLGEKVIKQHHTISQIINGLIMAGFTIETLNEPTPNAEILKVPAMEYELRRPMMLIVKAVKK